MGSDEYHCVECNRTGTRQALTSACPVFTRHCPMRNQTADGTMQSAAPSVEPDPTNPTHYKQGKVECIDAMEAATVNLKGIEAVCTANAMKYLWRWKDKNGHEDLRKAIWFINRLLGD